MTGTREPTDVEGYAAWLAGHARAFEVPATTDVSPFVALDEATEREIVAMARAWQAHRHSAGWAGAAVPVELGGLGGSRADAVRLTEQELRYHLPTHIYDVTLGMVLPTLIRWVPRRRDLVSAVLSGADLWCQLFSEPDAGSDLAALRTTASSDAGGGWRISGQKVWTSHAFFAQRGYLLARTAPGPRYGNLTAFAVDMAAPGVTVRRLTQATGAATFNEVFLDDVAVSDDDVIGPVGGGWRVAMTTLMNERLAIGAELVPYDALRAEAVRRGAFADPAVRRRLGEVLVARRVVEQVRARMFEAVRRGAEPGPEGSAGKLMLGAAVAIAAEVGLELIGDDALSNGPWQEFALATAGVRIAGGTDEIQRTIIAERILGLPKEPVAVRETR